MKKRTLRKILSVFLAVSILVSGGAFLISSFAENVPVVTNRTPIIKDCPSSKNLVPNPGFESELAWWDESEGAASGAYGGAADIKHDGNISAFYWKQEGMNAPLKTKAIPVEKNTQYTFSFWARGEIAGGAYVSLLSGTDKIGNVQLMPKWDKQWYQLGFSFTTGDAESVNIYIGAEGGKLYFDDFRLFKTVVTDPNPPFKDGPTDPTKNLVPNPGFEEGVDLLDWWRDGLHSGNLPAYGLSLQEGLGIKHSGNNSVFYSYPTADWANHTLETSPIPVEKNTEYTFSVWLLGDTRGDVFVSLLDNGEKIGNMELRPLDWDKQWHQVGFSFNSGDIEAISLYVGSGGGKLYFDDFQLFKTADAPLPDPYITEQTPLWPDTTASYNLVPNPGIESELEWWQESENALSGAYGYATDIKHSGNASTYYSATTADLSVALKSPRIAVKPNTLYTFSFWVRGFTQGGAFAALMYDGKTVGNVEIVPPAWDSQWHQVGYTFATGKADYVQIYIGSKGGTMYIDDYQLFEPKNAAMQEEAILITRSPDSMDSSQQNLFTNPGVEGDSWWNGSYNWEKSYSVDTSVKHSGNSSLKYSQAADNWNNSLFAPVITVQPYTSYTFSVWVRGDAPQGNAQFSMMTTETTDDKIGGPDVWFTPPVWDGRWRQVGYTFYTGKYTKLKFNIGSAKGTMYLDDFQLFETAKANPPTEKESSIVTLNPSKTYCADANNLFGANGGVESAGYWETGSNWNKGPYSRTAETQYNGQYSLKYTQTAGNMDDSYLSPEITVKPNTDYTFSVWIKGEVQGEVYTAIMTQNKKVGDSNDVLAPSAWDNRWHQLAYTFNTGKYTSIRLSIGSGGGTAYFDDFRLFEESKGIETPDKEANDPSGLRQVFHNLTCEDGDNRVANPGADNAEYWRNNAQGYGTFLTVSNDAAYEGSSSLKASGSGTYIKWLDVSPSTNYYLSIMLKGMPEVLGDIHYVLVDPDGQVIENVLSPDNDNYVWRGGIDTVLNVPSWDGNWHNRINRFNTGRESKIGIQITGTKGTLYLDNIKLFKEADAVSNKSANTKALLVALNDEKSACRDSDNLLVNGNFEGSGGIWTDVKGYGQYGVLMDAVKGNHILRYKGAGSNAHYIAWVDIQPNTEYTFSVYAQILKEGTSSFGVVDGGTRKNLLAEVEVNEVGGWKHYSVTFESAETTRVGFFVYDESGEAAFDKFRLFEASKGFVPAANDVPPLIDPNPTTGDFGSTGIALAAIVSAGVVFLVRRRRRAAAR